MRPEYVMRACQCWPLRMCAFCKRWTKTTTPEGNPK
jgi:hypothetical protein